MDPATEDKQIFVANETLAELIKDESQEITTVVIFVISAVLVITVIFVMAVLLDCRQQKIDNINNAISKKKTFRRRAKNNLQKAINALPTIGETSSREDEETIVDKMEEPSTSHAHIV